MKFIFDENTSEYVVQLMSQLGADVCHMNESFGTGTQDEEFLPIIAEQGLILITTDNKMRSYAGKHGHRALLEKHSNQVLFLPNQFGKWGAWKRAGWTIQHWLKIEEQVGKLPHLRLARITDNGKIELIE